MAVTPTLDDFNRPDQGPPPSANWTIIQSGVPELQVQSNAAMAPTGAGSGTDAWAPLPSLAACQVWFVVGVISSFGGFRVYSRLTGLNSTTYTCYTLKVESAGTVQLARYDSGGGTQTLLASVAQAHSVGDAFMLESLGSEHTVLFRPNGSAQWIKLLSAVDSTYQSGYIGMAINVDLVAAIDTFGGGAVTSSSFLETRPLRSRSGSW